MSDKFKHISCLIIDDEKNAISVIRHHLLDFPNYLIKGEFQDTLEAFNYLKSNSVDLLFLDIQMPGINGLDFLKALKSKPQVILTTAYRHYAPEAFELEVQDYLLKPISQLRFQQALQRYEKKKRSTEGSGYSDSDIVIRMNRIDHHVKVADICYIESNGDYLLVHTTGLEYKTKSTLKKFVQKLPPLQFKQIHRSYVVNTSKIEKQTNQWIAVDGVQLPIGKLFR